MRREPTPAPDLALGEALRAVVAVAGAAADERAALAAGLAWIVAALGADAGAVVRHGAVVTPTGWDGPPPAPAALGHGDGTAAIDSGRVVIARAGAPLDAAEVAWLQALVAALETTAALAGRLADERAARARRGARERPRPRPPPVRGPLDDPALDLPSRAAAPGARGDRGGRRAPLRRRELRRPAGRRARPACPDPRHRAQARPRLPR